jgi:hypothetical protein
VIVARPGLRFSTLLSALVLAAAPARPDAQITIVNGDGPTEGFNDATPATPVGGNTGTTVGQQRLIAFQRAAAIWGALLDSPVEIRIHATFDPLTCDATSGTLGAARPASIVSNSPSAPVRGAWYALALASKFAGVDLTPAGDDITATFNSRLGDVNCLDGSGWYYGLDDAHGEKIDLVSVLLHEFGHGLGFLTFVDATTGQEFLNQPDVFESFILDTSTNKHWTAMTADERVASATNTGALVWDGTAAVAEAPAFLGALPVLTVGEPSSIAGDIAIGTASFGAAVTEVSVSGPLVQATDAQDIAGPASTDGCSVLTNASDVAGKVALVDRGTCTFVEKALNVQAAGAIGMVVVDNVASASPSGMSGTEPSITIPCVRITLADGETLRANLAGGVAVALRTNPRRLAGAGAGKRPLLYAPNPLEPGSSVSHWDTSATPNLLMEPNINDDLGHDVDLTLPLLRDLGWRSDEFPAPQPRQDPAGGGVEHATRTVERP